MLIGIVGFIGSGKGTLGDILVNDYDFEQDSFAKPLKDAVSIIFGWDRDLLEGDTEESRKFREKVDPYWSKICEFELSPRLALQRFGTESIRDVFHPNVWSASLIQRYEMTNLNTVVTDCRFKNEIKAIQEADGQVWRIKRGEEPEWYNHYWTLYQNQDSFEIEKCRAEGIFPHRSETDWIGSEFDLVIDNDGTLSDLKCKVDMIMESEIESSMNKVCELQDCRDMKKYFGG
jgi:hypothetical protein